MKTFIVAVLLHVMLVLGFSSNVFAQEGRPVLVASTTQIADFHLCPICGYIELGEAPEKCPVCGALAKVFTTIA